MKSNKKVANYNEKAKMMESTGSPSKSSLKFGQTSTPASIKFYKERCQRLLAEKEKCYNDLLKRNAENKIL